MTGKNRNQYYILLKILAKLGLQQDVLIEAEEVLSEYDFSYELW